MPVVSFPIDSSGFPQGSIRVHHTIKTTQSSRLNQEYCILPPSRSSALTNTNAHDYYCTRCIYKRLTLCGKSYPSPTNLKLSNILFRYLTSILTSLTHHHPLALTTYYFQMSFNAQIEPTMSVDTQANPAYSGQPTVHPNGLLDMQVAVTQALANQTAMFDAKLQSRDAVIERLMAKLENITVNTNQPPSIATGSKATSKKKSTPRKPVGLNSSTPVKQSSRAVSEPPPSLSKTQAVKSQTKGINSPAKDKPSTPQKKRPHQVILSQYPEGFEKTKVSQVKSPQHRHVSLLIRSLVFLRPLLKFTLGSSGV